MTKKTMTRTTSTGHFELESGSVGVVHIFLCRIFPKLRPKLPVFLQRPSKGTQDSDEKSAAVDF
jgi:hypothetical protein